MSLLGEEYDAKIKGFEGYMPSASWDYKQHSSGWGTRAKPGEVIDEAEAQRRYDAEIAKAHSRVREFAPDIDHGTAAALTSLTYNSGDAWTRSGLGAAIKAGDLDRARASFLQYTNAGGQHLPGLAARRRGEVGWIGAGGSPSDVAPAPDAPPTSRVAGWNSNDQQGVRPSMPINEEQQPGLLDNIAGRTIYNPAFQGGLGMFLASARGDDPNAGMRSGTESGNAIFENHMKMMEMRRRQAQQLATQRMFQDPNMFKDMPPDVRTASRIDPSIGMNYINKHPEIQMEREKLALTNRGLEETVAGRKQQFQQHEQMYPLEVAKARAAIAASTRKEPGEEFKAEIFRRATQGMQGGEQQPGAPAIGRQPQLLPQSFDGTDQQQPQLAFNPTGGGPISAADPNLIQAQSASPGAQPQPQSQPPQAPWPEPKAAPGGVTLPGFKRPLTLGEMSAFALSKDPGKFMKELLDEEKIGKATQTKIEEQELAAHNGIARLTQIEQSFKPEYLTLEEKTKQYGVSWVDSIGVLRKKLPPDVLAAHAEFTAFQRDAFENLTLGIKEATGAAMGIQEEARIRKGLPDPAKDGPTEFMAKLQGTKRALQMSLARTQYLRKNGFPEINGHGAEARMPVDQFKNKIRDDGARIYKELKIKNPNASRDELIQGVDQAISEHYGVNI